MLILDETRQSGFTSSSPYYSRAGAGACLECLCAEFLTGARGCTVHLAFQNLGTGYTGTGKLSHSLCGRSGLLSVTVGAPYVTA